MKCQQIRQRPHCQYSDCTRWKCKSTPTPCLPAAECRCRWWSSSPPLDSFATASDRPDRRLSSLGRSGARARRDCTTRCFLSPHRLPCRMLSLSRPTRLVCRGEFVENHHWFFFDTYKCNIARNRCFVDGVHRHTTIECSVTSIILFDSIISFKHERTPTQQKKQTLKKHCGQSLAK